LVGVTLLLQSLSQLADRPIMVDLTIEEGQRLKVVYGSGRGFHAVDLDTMDVFDIYVPQHVCVHITCTTARCGLEG